MFDSKLTFSKQRYFFEAQTPIGQYFITDVLDDGSQFLHFKSPVGKRSDLGYEYDFDLLVETANEHYRGLLAELKAAAEL